LIVQRIVIVENPNDVDATGPAYDEISRTIQHDMVADVEKMLTYIASQLQQREGQVSELLCCAFTRRPSDKCGECAGVR
jgi:hypothetical protein